MSITINTKNRNSDQTNQKACRRFLKLYQENSKIFPAWSGLTHATFKLHPAPLGSVALGEETYHLLERSTCWQVWEHEAMMFPNCPCATPPWDKSSRPVSGDLEEVNDLESSILPVI